MLRNVKDLQGYAIRATDGVIGKVEDMYFDDEGWAIRYLVVDTGNWLSGRKVLISPLAIGHPDWLGQLLPVALTKAQVEKSPDVDTRQPVSRQHEATYLGYYGYPQYWGGAGLWGMGAYPGDLTTAGAIEANLRARQTSPAPTRGDSHLRGCRAVIGYHIHATDGDIGHVEDFIVDDRTWAIRYLVVNTSNWWVGHSMLVAPPWIEAVNWSTAKVSVDLTRHAIQSAPPYDAVAQFTREQEQALYEHYGRSAYWAIKPRHDETVPFAM
jgi:sporulation protein YlmC with PRC-barrel domain